MSKRPDPAARSGKLLFLIPKLHGGGAERALSYVMNALAEDYEVTVITLDPPDPAQDYYVSDAVRILTADRYRGRTVPSYLGTLRQIRALKRRERFDVAVSFLPEAHFFNILTRTTERVYISIRNHTGLRRRYVPHDIFGPLAERLHPLADKVICVSEDVAHDEAEHFRIPEEKLVVIRNGIRREDILAQAAAENGDTAFLRFAGEHPFLFANSGRLVIQKGQWHLLRAFARLRQDAPEAGLFLLGEGELGERLREEAQRLGLGDAVFFCGRKANPFPYLKYAQVFVLSSLYEGFPNVLLEAMAMGLPIVADDCPGVREALTPRRRYGEAVQGVVHGDFGLVSERLDNNWPETDALSSAEEALYCAMLEAYRDPALRGRCIAAGTRRLGDFTIEQRKAEWETLIREGALPGASPFGGN
ncbi:MAG: glycosyltransferase [Oscillospiraceae bacterium]|nr:glycosyltransferase [Oscillospiraceae bacterium]